ncbi:hypothetical protein [Empedobacter brevis]|uniref:hypothetical protein n=1 Tax=Empedobacter brevis TaxID=247 RepID=UPI00289DB9FA|nr:hypothetical protein [Empedobacter brevis]
MIVYKSTDQNIELRIIGYDEPNNGRELHVAELYMNGKNCSEKYFINQWNRLNFNLDEFQFESKNQKHVFIPAEGYSFVINCEDFSVIYTDFKGLSTVQFLKNKFSEDKLQLFYKDEIVEIHLLGDLEKE